MHLEVCASSGFAQRSVIGRTIEMACHLHPILSTWDAITTCTFLSTRTCLHLTLCLYPCLPHPSYLYGLSLIVKGCALAACSLPASTGSPFMSSTKWPTTYTRYFALRMQLPPAPQSPFSFRLGCGYARKKKQKKKQRSFSRVL